MSKTVVHLTSVAPPYYSRLFHKKCLSAATAGYRVVIIAPWPHEGKRSGVDIVSVRRYKSRVLRMTVTVGEVILKALRANAHLYHVEDPELLPWAVLLRKLTGIPVIYDLKEYHRAAILWKEWIPRPLRPVVGVLTEWAQRICVRRLDGLVVVNEDLEASFGPIVKRVAMVGNYPSRAAVAPPAMQRDPNMIVYVGGIGKERGYEVLLDALQVIHEHRPEAYAVVVGDVARTGMSREYTEKEGRLAEQGVLRLIGHVSYDEMWSHLYTASVAWIPWLRSPNNERGLPNKLFEYMAATVPVVIPDLKFMSRILREVGCGLIVEAAVPEAHAAAILRLLQDPPLAREMAWRGREAVLRRYNWETEAEKLLDLYEKVMQRAG